MASTNQNIVMLTTASLIASWAAGIGEEEKYISCPATSIAVYKMDDYLPGSIVRTYNVSCPNQPQRAIAKFEYNAFDPKQTIEFKVKHNRLISVKTELTIALSLLILNILAIIAFNISWIKNDLRKTLG